MPKIVNRGPLGYVARSWASLIFVSVSTVLRRTWRGPLAPGWSLDFEIGNLFWRGQFNRAFAMPDIRQARLYFDSVMTWTDEEFKVVRSDPIQGLSIGEWVSPPKPHSEAVLLYLHGGGYTFYSDISRRFADMLAALLGVRIFVPNYRLTPEHPHPAQLDDALAAYRDIIAEGVSPKNIVIIGDSAGGHLTLMTLIALRDAGLPQPSLAIGLCPWTDIGDRGHSLYGNDRYDLVQGYMAVRFGEWLMGATGHSRESLSPIHQSYSGLAPLYLQGGGREVLIDMIREFAQVVAKQGCDVTLDVWPEMTHNFQAHGLTRPESSEAIGRIQSAIAYYLNPQLAGTVFGSCAATELRSVNHKLG